ncbi:MAG: Ig-like domain-containing protein [Tannerellaceae bacterium]|jgi:hypothetical protein|nr:Ig-like domain-containing protein [Tannerellaceae bacterium]
MLLYVSTSWAQYYAGKSVVYGVTEGKSPALYFGNSYYTLWMAAGSEVEKMAVLSSPNRVAAAYHTRCAGMSGWDFGGDSIPAEAPFLIEAHYDGQQQLAYYHIKGDTRPDKHATAAALLLTDSQGIDLSEVALRQEEYYLHLRLRVHEAEDFIVLLSDGKHLRYVPIENRGRAGTVPSLGGKYAFPADGEWYEVDISLEDFRIADTLDHGSVEAFDLFGLAMVDTVAMVGIAAGKTDSWRLGGANENLDIDVSEVFFYRKMESFKLQQGQYVEELWDRKKEVSLNYVLGSGLNPTGTPAGVWWEESVVGGERPLTGQLRWESEEAHRVTVDRDRELLVFHPFFAGETEVLLRTGFAEIADTCHIHVRGLQAKLKDGKGSELVYPLIGVGDTLRVRVEYQGGGEVIPWAHISLPPGLQLLSSEEGWVSLRAVSGGTSEIVAQIPFERGDSTFRYPVYVTSGTRPGSTTTGEGISCTLPPPGIGVDVSDVAGYLWEGYFNKAEHWEWTSMENEAGRLSSSGVWSGIAVGVLHGARASLKGTSVETSLLDLHVVRMDSLSPVTSRSESRRGQLGNNSAFTLHYTSEGGSRFPLVWESEDDSIEVNHYDGRITIKGSTRGKHPVVAYLDGNAALRAEGYISYWPYADSVVITTPDSVQLTVGNQPFALVAGAEVWPEYGVNRKLRWESMNPEIVEVDAESGAVRPLSKGVGVIRAVAAALSAEGRECADTFVVEVEEPPTQVAGVPSGEGLEPVGQQVYTLLGRRVEGSELGEGIYLLRKVWGDGRQEVTKFRVGAVR